MKAKGPWVLGLASSAHNGAACLLKGQEIVVAIQEERLTRIKRARLSAGVPSLAISYCLEVAGIQARDLDAIVTCVLENKSAPRHEVQKNTVLREARCPTFVLTHHLGHAISTFATSGFSDAAILVVDGAGSLLGDLEAGEAAVTHVPPLAVGAPEICEAHSMYEGRDAGIVPIAKQMGWWLEESENPGMKAFASLGGMYSAVGEQIFGDPLNGPGKVMGLSPFGRPSIAPDEFFRVSQEGLDFRREVTQRFPFDDRWPSHRAAYQDLAASVQAALEEALIGLIGRLRKSVDTDRLCYAGGVALNSIANEKLLRAGIFKELFIVPAAEDSGTAIGAAFHGLWQLERPKRHRLQSDALGRSYTTSEILTTASKVPGIRIEPTSDVVNSTVDLLARRKFVGWFQDGSELGPRALGQRSILCDPRAADMKDQLNLRIKHREEFRPFAPVILAEEVERWFDVEQDLDSPFMLRVWPFRADRISQAPAVAHCDGSGRVQTVARHQNPRLYAVIEEFFRRTNVPILLNTSLNVAGDPIVETPEDAAWTLLETDLDACVIGNFVVTRQEGYSSLLDLVITATSVTPDREGYVEFHTPWGTAKQRVPSSWETIRAELVEPIKGHTLATRPAIVAALDPRSFVRDIAFFRRVAMVRLSVS